MRFAVLLFLVLGALFAACTSTDAPDEDCIKAGGLCFFNDNVANCPQPIAGAACSAGYTCCTYINAYNVRDGGTYDAGPAPKFVSPDAALEAEASADAHPDTGTQDASAEAATDASVKDAAVKEAAAKDASGG